MYVREVKAKMLDYKQVNEYWFGHVEQTIVPSEHRAKLWFGEDRRIDDEMRNKFGMVLDEAIQGDFNHWMERPRGRLGLIIILDQFSRHIYRNSPLAFSQDYHCLEVCLRGLAEESDHHLSLIERVFFYFPLLHSENLTNQDRAVHCYHMLSELAFPETRVIYDSFLKFANHHYNIIQRFGRFPQRNRVLGRESTPEERLYLSEFDHDLE
jgi:uncharacterized protein (DUF924 family)